MDQSTPALFERERLRKHGLESMSGVSTVVVEASASLSRLLMITDLARLANHALSDVVSLKYLPFDWPLISWFFCIPKMSSSRRNLQVTMQVALGRHLYHFDVTILAVPWDAPPDAAVFDDVTCTACSKYYSFAVQPAYKSLTTPNTNTCQNKTDCAGRTDLTDKRVR